MMQSSVTSEDDDMNWIAWHCQSKGNELFCEVDEDYIHDKFNLTGLSDLVPYYRYALDIILDMDSDSPQETEALKAASEQLYGLIHARYILTNRGLDQMIHKYNNGEFGNCPRAYCGDQNTLPIGENDRPETSTVKMYCPKCEQLYIPRLSRHFHVDGAYFGSTFPHMLFAVHPHLRPERNNDQYIPKIYGYKVHSSAHTAQIRARKETLRLVERTKRIRQQQDEYRVKVIEEQQKQ